MIIHRSKRAKKILSIRSKFGRKQTHELLLYKSNKYIYGSVISLSDGNSASKVLFSCSTLSLKKEGIKPFGEGKIDPSSQVGLRLGAMCKEKGINPCFNVAEYAFHGRVKALIDSFRSVVNS